MFKLFTKSFIDAEGNVLEKPVYGNDYGVMRVGKRLYACLSCLQNHL